MKTCFKYLALAALSLWVAIPVQASTSFSLEMGGEPILVGSFFDVDVVVHDLFAVDEGDELLAFGFNVRSTDHELMRFIGSSSKAPFSEDGLLLGLDAAGLAFPGVANSLAVSQSFTLATLHFQALAAGQVSLAVDSDLTDLNQGLFFLNQGQIAINASRNFAVTAVPLPPSALMFVSTLLIGLVSRSKRRN